MFIVFWGSQHTLHINYILTDCTQLMFIISADTGHGDVTVYA